MARKSKKSGKRPPGSFRRKPVGEKARWHNMPNGKRVLVSGEVMRVGGQLAEIVKTS